MVFSQNFIEEVLQANNIVDTISSYTTLKNSGRDFKGLCPFPEHKEKTPSFCVSAEKQLYHCFGCQRSGNIYTFCREMMGLSFVESVKYLAQKASISLPQESAPDPSGINRKAMKSLNGAVKDIYKKNLLSLSSSHFAKKYCRKRGLSEKFIAEFEIGYAASHLHITDTLQKQDLSKAQTLGLIKQDSQTKKYYDTFRNRLIFPIHSRTNDVVGFGGRALGENQVPKYLNSSESPVFNKKKILYGLHKSARFIRQAGFCIVVEGYMDFLALYQSGITHVTATLGTAFTPFHARLLLQSTSHVTLLFDGDEAGQKAAQKSLPILLAEGIKPRAFFLSENLDPDDYLKQKGVDELKKQIHKAPCLLTLILDKHLRNFQGRADEVVRCIDEVGPIIAVTKDVRLKELYIQDLAQKLGKTEPWVGRQIARLNHSPEFALTQQEILESSKISLKQAPEVELTLLHLALQSPHHLKTILEAQILPLLSHAGVRELFCQWQERMKEKTPSDWSSWMAILMTLVDFPQTLINLKLKEDFEKMEKERQNQILNDCIKRVQESSHNKKIRDEILKLKKMGAEKQNERKLHLLMTDIKAKHDKKAQKANLMRSKNES